MTKITIDTETIITELTPSEASAKIKEALGIAEFPQIGDRYWFVNSLGDDEQDIWGDVTADRHRLAHGNCSPTQEGLAQYKADEAKKAAIVAIRKHRDKTFGVFEPGDDEERVYGKHYEGSWGWEITYAAFGGIAVPFFSDADILRSFTECGEHWEVLK